MHEYHPITKAVITLLRAYSSDPSKIEFKERFATNMLEITVEPPIQDLRIIIGKQGKTIMGLRQVAERMGRRIGLEVKVEIRDTFRGDAEPERKPFEPNQQWEAGGELSGMIREFLTLIYDRLIQIVYEDKGNQLYVILDVPQNDLGLVKAMGVAFYPFGYRNGRKLSFRITNYHPNEHNPDTDRVSPGMASGLA